MPHYTRASGRRETESVAGEQHVCFVLGGRHSRVQRVPGGPFFAVLLFI